MSPLGDFQQISCKAQTGMYGPRNHRGPYMPVWGLQLPYVCVFFVWVANDIVIISASGYPLYMLYIETVNAELDEIYIGD